MKTIFEYSDYRQGQTIRAKVCIVGSGCGGATLAKKLAEKGMDVVIIEQGGYYTSASFDNRELNMSGKVDAERNLATTANGDTLLLYGNNVGGASVHYWADSYRTPADRLQLWQDKYDIEDHTQADLSPAWDELEATLNVHEAEEEYYNSMNLKVRAAAQALGWQGAPIPQARKGCQKSGHCMQGCFFNAKQSQLVTHIPLALEKGASLYADLRADYLEWDGARVKKLWVSAIDRPSNRPSGLQLSVVADAFVIAAGGYNTPAFMLRQEGFAQRFPALGKHFGMNPSAFTYGLYDEDIILWRNMPAAWGVEQFRLARYDQQHRYQEGGYLLMANQTQPATIAATIGGFGAEAHEWMMKLPKVGSTIGWIDDHEDELGNVSIDSSGKRLISYPYGPITQQILRDLLKKQVVLSFETGAKKVLIADYQATTLHSVQEIHKIDKLAITNSSLLLAAPHPFGGCRMGKDPKTSVVDSSHRVHGFDNLFISDPSVFPTGPSVDPSLTIMAFSYIAAQQIATAVA
ncbi:MAG: GMC family oxidoreductase [Spirosomataceae bacterium]